MIKEINIKNFKSIENLSLDLGRVNVIIGANGSGKTNILEAIAMGAAASADKLDYEFLSNRIRVTTPDFMRNAIGNSKGKKIHIDFKTNNNGFNYLLKNSEWDNRNWIETNREKRNIEIQNYLNHSLSKELGFKRDEPDENFKELLNNEKKWTTEIAGYLIYSPEYYYLNKFEEPGQILPLGIKGEGLFYTLKEILTDKRKKKQIATIKEYLHLLDWFQDVSIPGNLISNEFKIAIKDRFVNPKYKHFDQKSANEGFLLLLFYLVLFTSKNTPGFFAIDNIEAGFNPKLCKNLMISFNKLAKENKKQVIFTTHNPAILDGLDLKDKTQRLFVVYRSRNGSTAIERIEHKPQSKKKLSELWMSGIIGGLPDNF